MAVRFYVAHGASGSSASMRAHVEGLKRRGFTPDTLTRLNRAYKTLYRSSLTLEQAKQRLARQATECPELRVMLEFLSASTRGIVR